MSVNFSPSQVLHPKVKAARWAWGGFTAVLPLYWGIAYQNATSEIYRQSETLDPGVRSILIWTAIGVGVVSFIAFAALNGFGFSEAAVPEAEEPSPGDDEEYMTSWRDPYERISDAGVTEPFCLAVHDRWFNLHLAAWGLNQVVALTGVVLAVSSQSAGKCIPFISAAAVLNLMMYPRRSTLAGKIVAIARRKREKLDSSASPVRVTPASYEDQLPAEGENTAAADESEQKKSA